MSDRPASGQPFTDFDHRVTASALGPDAEPETSVATEEFSRYDLRLRSLDRQPGEPINLCSSCKDAVPASWSVWLHTPEWGSGDRGDTRVLCTHHALQRVGVEARHAV